MKIYGLGSCDTCRKARKDLPEAEFIDVREGLVPKEILLRAWQEFGPTLLNTRSKTWRSLSESDRAGVPLDLIVDHPLLMKRPLIERSGTYYLGWTREVQEALGLAP
jgi:arsenate reductase